MSNLDLKSKIQVQSKKDAGSWEQSAKLGMSQEVVDGTTGWGRHRKTGMLNNGDARRGGHQTNFQNKGKECHRKMGDGAGRECMRGPPQRSWELCNGLGMPQEIGESSESWGRHGGIGYAR